MRKVIRVNFSPLVCEMLRWDAAAHFLFMKSVYSSIFPLLCLSTPQKLKKWYDRHRIVKHSVFSSTHSISLQTPLPVSVISKDVYYEWSSILWGSSVVRSVPVFAAARAIVSFRGKYIWISVRPVTDNEAKLYLDTFYFPTSHYQTKILALYCILSPLSNSKTVFQDKETKTWCTSYLYVHLKYSC